MGSYQTAITINDVLNNIHSRKYLIPAIQRKYVWTTEQIESLFDSIMRNYPINSFMFWKVTDEKIKDDLRFYQFLTAYKESDGGNNEYIDVKGKDEFVAVIDGQQRLTSIYLGLSGSYVCKGTEEKYLYLDISSPLPEDDERNMSYNFKFLSENDLKKEQKNNPDAKWFRVNDILRYKDKDLEKVELYFVENNLTQDDFKDFNFARWTLMKLHRKVFTDQIINYYLEDSQNEEEVLDIFVRTNSGGTKLSFSDLLMSKTTSQWKNKDARKAIEETKKEVKSCGFDVNTDFVLKTCLFLFNDNIKFQIKNFKVDMIKKFEDNWDRIDDSIVAAFNLLKSWGFDELNLTSKNAVIPIVFYIYTKGIETEITKPTYNKDEKEQIRKWLCLSLLKKVFGGQSDTILTKIKSVMNETEEKGFPFKDIKEAFKGNPTKNLYLTSDYIDSLLHTDINDSYCYSILSLLYAHLDYNNKRFHKDHLHPKSYFTGLRKKDDMDEETYKFYKDKANYNSVVNLQLLNGYVNESKNATSLKEWVEKNKIDKKFQLIPENVSLDIKDFKIFIKERETLLKKRLLEVVGYVDDNVEEN